MTSFWVRKIATMLALWNGGFQAIADEPKKIALVVGVSLYAKDGLANLRFAAKDADDLATELTNQRFSVLKLTGSQATKAAVDRELERFFKVCESLTKQDVVLVALSGHGVQRDLIVSEGDQRRIVETPFFCVYDSLASNPPTMINLNSLLDSLKERSGSSSNLLLVDACRNNSVKGAKTLDGGTVKELPTKISVLFSSSPGQRSYEASTVQHGVFTHVLLGGLRGAAKNSRGDVDWVRLAAHVMSEVPIVAPELLDDPGVIQRPNLIGNLVNSPVIGSLPRSSLPSNAPTRPAPPSEEKSLPKQFTNIIGMRFQRIEAGSFVMGDDDGKNEKPAHQVEITRPFYIGVHEVTQKQWNTVMPDQTSPWKDEPNSIDGDDVAASYISYEDAMLFVTRINEMNAEKGRRYRLPTEAEWEYACRAGTSTRCSFGNSAADLSDHAWWGADDAGNTQNEKYAHQVGMKKSNAWGLFDMHGNVFEWCEDLYDDKYYGRSPRRDPVNLTSGTSRVLRGGGWNFDAGFCCSACRVCFLPSYHRFTGIGFRVVMSLE